MMYRLSDKEADLLPPAFLIEDLAKCREDGNTYCTVQSVLHPLNNNSEAWKLINRIDSKIPMTPMGYIHRGICFDKTTDVDTLKEMANQVMSNSLKKYELTSTVHEIGCRSGSVAFGSYDYGLLSVFIAYLAFLVYISFFKSKRGKFLNCFSLSENVKSIGNSPRKLKFIEGLRAITMINVIITHVAMFVGLSFMANVHDFNLKMQLNDFNIPLYYLVQYFFITSGWFLMYNVQDIVDTNGTLTVIDVGKLIFNRFVRFLPTIVVILVISQSNLIAYLIQDGIYMLYERILIQNCQNNKLPYVFFFNNKDFKESCLPHSWYLSADMQLYVTSLIILYLFYKYKINLKHLLSIIFVAFCILVSLIYVRLKSSGLNERRLPFSERLGCQYLELTYYATLPNLMAFYFGMVSGLLYYKNKNRRIFDTLFKKIAWALIVLSFHGILLVDLNGDGLLKSIYVAASKPIYSLGYCLLLLGLSDNLFSNHKILSKIQQIFEWKYLLYVANFNYSTYMIHILTLGIIYFSRSDFHKFSYFGFLLQVVFGILVSIGSGFVFYILFEKPSQNLLKLYGPQVKKNVKQAE